MVALPESSVGFGTGQWKFHFERLLSEGRAASAVSGGRVYWVAAERAKTFSLLFPDAQVQPVLADVEATAPSRDDALLTLVTECMRHLGPATAGELGETLGLPAAEISGALLRMEASGTVLRGNFSGTTSRAGAPAPQEPGQPGAAVPTQTPETEWCERRFLARGHRPPGATLRRQDAPGTAGAILP